jgi:membrane-associated protease RseP (regulator of RpoE activity)
VTRESRLLLVTIAVSATVLLLLAQLRFPEPPAVAAPTAPLERLAARASFEDLATRVAQVETGIAQNLVVLRLAPETDPAPSRLADILTARDASATGVRHVPALRLDATTGLAAIPPHSRITGIIGEPASGTAGIVAADSIRGIARVRLPERPVRPIRQRSLADLRTPTYVVAVEGTQAGLTVRPVFLGRSERFQSPRWERPLLPLGGVLVTPGALIFTLDGEFLGCVIADAGTPAIAGAGDVVQVVESLLTAPQPPVDPGLALQPLTPRLAAATGAARGVVVAEVISGSPAAGTLQPGDVITEVAAQAVNDPDAALLALATRLGAGPVAVGFIRNQMPMSGSLEPAARPAQDPAASTGLALETIRGAGTRVNEVPTDGPLAAAGLQRGDTIVHAGGIELPTAAQLRGAFADAAPGSMMILGIRRGDRQWLATVDVPALPDGTRR